MKCLAKFELYDFLLCLASAVDLVDPKLHNHHQQVAYLSFRLAQQMGLTAKDQRAVLMQGLLHDIGALTLRERVTAADIEEGPLINIHAIRSARLLMQCGHLVPLAAGVKYHHIPWDHRAGLRFRGCTVPLNSHILHVADRVCIRFGNAGNSLAAVPDIMAAAHERENTEFSPAILKALDELADKEYIWLELSSTNPLHFLPNTIQHIGQLDLDEALEVSLLFSHVIDFRSRFTATHSAGVANTAQKLAQLAGMSENESKMMLIAGYLHDLGKLAIPEMVLEKPGKLDNLEISIVRSHTFHTFQLLSMIRGFEQINQWASFHHERLNGKGYPFHLKEEQIPLGSRIMAVADVFTAIAEDRPYRLGMSREEIIRVLRSMVDSRALCKSVVNIVVENIDELIGHCHTMQARATEDYDRFFREEEAEEQAVADFN